MKNKNKKNYNPLAKALEERDRYNNQNVIDYNPVARRFKQMEFEDNLMKKIWIPFV